jgi:hypothetical protein
MTVQLPNREPGRTYHRAEVEEYIAPQVISRPVGDIRTDDYRVAVSRFVEERNGVAVAEVVMEYALLPLTRFASYLDRLRSNLAEGEVAYQAEHQSKVEAIKARLSAGEPALPVWIDKSLADSDPMAVWEGNHRLLAFSELGIPLVPVFLLKYADKE